MFKFLKRIVKKMIYSFRCDEEAYISFLRKGGAEIGERVRIFDPQNTVIDATRPFMIKIGNDVQITSGVTILTHGYDWSVLKGIHGEVLGSCGEVSIGNNVFIGMHTTILKGVKIGNNCIIGANSLVNKDVEDGWVVAGNPAKPIIKVEEYYKKRVAEQLDEAEDLYRCYVKRVGSIPPKKVFHEFFWLFEERKNTLEEFEEKQMKTVGNYSYAMERFVESKPMFNGYEAFLEHMRSKLS